eukprot:13468194-Alexandrium_andersonii.AAC.1
MVFRPQVNRAEAVHWPRHCGRLGSWARADPLQRGSVGRPHSRLQGVAEPWAKLLQPVGALPR